MTRQSHEEVYVWILTVATFLLVSIMFFPFTTDASIMDKDTQFVTKPIYRVIANWDEQKLTDIWKINKKSDYERKEKTLNNYIWEFLTIEMGLSDEAAAGIFGNMMVECGSRSFNLQPYIYSPGGAYYGLCQWSTSNHHAGINGGSVEEQLEYLASTIREEMDEYGYSAFEGATDPETAADYFARWYERCSVPTGRREEARRAYERFAG